MKIYFYKYENIDNLSQYKKNWYQQIYDGIIKYGKKISIIDNILEADIIITIVDYIGEIEMKYNLELLKKKLVIISCQDPVTIIKSAIINQNVLYMFDHLKLINVPNFFLKFNNSYSYSKYLLNEYYKLENENIIYDEDNEFKRLYEHKTKCILNTSNIYRRIYDDSPLPLSERKYDVIYIGNLNFTGLLLPHRKDVVEKLKVISQNNNLNVYLGENNDGNKLSLHKYYRMLKKTKIVISPWGWGEWSLKEFECICFGVHCIIPNKHLINYPNFNQNFDEYSVDFSDLEEKIMFAINNLDITQQKINANRTLFLEYNNEKQINQIEELLFY